MTRNTGKKFGLKALALIVIFLADSSVLGQEQVIQLFSGGTGTLRILVRDSETHAALPAWMTIRKMDADAGTAAMASVSLRPGWNVFSLPPGRYEDVVQSPGYKPISDYFSVEAGVSLPPTDVGLDPITSSYSRLDEAASSSAPAGMGYLHGFVYDAASAAPLAGVNVYLEKTGARALTDEKGYFRLYYPLPTGVDWESVDPSVPLPTDNLAFERAGFNTTALLFNLSPICRICFPD